MVAEEHITAFNWASTQEIDDMMAMTLRVNDYLSGLFGGVGHHPGRLQARVRPHLGERFLADHDRRRDQPDDCLLWDALTNEKLDKDRFRRDLGRVEEAYQEVARRLGILPEGGVDTFNTPQTGAMRAWP